MNCGGADVGASGYDQFTRETDQYLAENAQPFFAIPLWLWLALGAGAFWYFWGRKHIDLSEIFGARK
jgi:hypothetical protein